MTANVDYTDPRKPRKVTLLSVKDAFGFRFRDTITLEVSAKFINNASLSCRLMRLGIRTLVSDREFVKGTTNVGGTTIKYVSIKHRSPYVIAAK